MWTLVRVLVVAFALAGLVGQSGAYAAPPHSPARVAAAMDDCPDSGAMADRDAPGPDRPCQDSSPACMAQPGCAAPLAVLPAALHAPVPVVTTVRLSGNLQKSPDEVQGARILRPPIGRG